MQNITGFDIGNKAQRMIAASLSCSRLAHAVILEGGTAEERLNLAKKIAAALLCESDDEVPCGTCKHCRKIFSGSHPDVITYSPTKENKNIAFRVDTVRALREDCFVMPNEAKGKVFFLTDTQLMNIQAQNAFLKILEEPPKNIHFIMLCSNKSVFLDTIISRTTAYTIGGIRPDVFNDIDAQTALNAAKGVALAWSTGYAFEIVKACGAFDKNKNLLTAAMPFLQEITAAALRKKFLCEEDCEYEKEAKLLSKKKSTQALIDGFDSIQTIISAVSANANVNLTVARLASLLAG